MTGPSPLNQLSRRSKLSAYVSVVLVTHRVGGLDIVFDSLSRQIFKDFELIISDGLYQYRKELVAEKIKDYSFRVKHIEPFNNPFPNNAFCRYANSGLAHADCKVVVFITDYTFLPSESLLKHARHYMTNPELGYMACHRYFKLNNVHPDFPNYTDEPVEKDNDLLYNHSNDDTLKYAEDVRSGKLNSLMWSLFEQNFNYETYNMEWDPLLAVADPKSRLEESGLINLSWFHGKNESCGLENILRINGWDESLDGGHGFQDTDLSDRLTKLGGITAWHFDFSNGCYLINPRPIFPHGFRHRSVQDNGDIWRAKMEQGYPSNNQWSLKRINELNRARYKIDEQLQELMGAI